MANNLDTSQQKKTFSVNRETFLNKVVKNDNLSKKDLRVLLLLLTSLPGFYDKPDRDDPRKFEAIHAKTIAENLGLKKKDVEKSIETLCYLDLLETGSSETVKNGYRLTF